MSQENVELAVRLFEAFNESDAEAAVAIWATDGEWRPAIIGGGVVEGAVYRGHEGVREFFRVQGETWETVRAIPASTRDYGSRVLVEVRLEAIGRGSGIPVTRTTWNVFETRDGRIVAGAVYLTESEAVEAVAS